MKCDNCKNKDICKHVEYMQNVEEKIKSLELDANIAISIDIKCYHMQDSNIVTTKSKLFDFGNYDYEKHIKPLEIRY